MSPVAEIDSSDYSRYWTCRNLWGEVTVKYLGEKDSSKLPPACYLSYKYLYASIYQNALNGYKPNQYQKSGKLVFSFVLDSNKKLKCTGLVTGIHPITDSAFLKFAKEVEIWGYESDVAFEIPLFINVAKFRTEGFDTLDLWNLWNFDRDKFHLDHAVQVMKVNSGFIGGKELFEDYLRDNLQVPLETMDKELGREIIVIFEVGEKGKISGVEFESPRFPDHHDSLWFKEVKRVLTRAPKLIPAQHCGRSVRTFHRLRASCRTRK